MAARPEPSPDLLSSLAQRLGQAAPARVERVRRSRYGMVVVVAAAGLIIFAAFGGVSSAAHAGRTVYQTVKRTASSAVSSSSASSSRRSETPSSISSGSGSSSSGGSSSSSGGGSSSSGNDDRGSSGSSSGSSSGGGSGNSGDDRNPKVTICHATGSTSNPWVSITIAQSALSAHSGHGDIIPAPSGGCPTGGGSHGGGDDDHHGGDDDHPGDDQYGHKVAICHKTSSTSNPWVLIFASQSALAAHAAHGDIIPAPLHGCPGLTINHKPEVEVEIGGTLKPGGSAVATAQTDDSDGDPVKVTFVWRVNGVVVRTTTLTSSPTDTLSLAGLRSSDRVSVTATPNDGIENGESDTDTVTLTNSKPRSTVHLHGDFRPGGTITASCDSSDDDGDRVEVKYEWRVNGVVKKVTGDTAASDDTFKLVGYRPSDRITVTVVPTDGVDAGDPSTDSADLRNTAPVATVRLGGTLKLGGTATATATASDEEDDAVKLTYVWKVNGATRKTTSSTPALADSFSLAGLRGSDNVTVTVTPNDGTLDGAAVSDSTDLRNNAPTAAVTLGGTFNVGGSATATAAPSDDDGDAVKLTYVWKVNGSAKRTISATGATSDTFSLAGLRPGDDIAVTVTPNDGTVDGAAASASAVVANHTPTVVVGLGGTIKPGGSAIATAAASDADGDTIKLTYVWTVNGSVKRTVTGTTAATDTYSLADGRANDVIVVTVTPNDGTGNGASGSATATIVNHPPTATVALAGTALAAGTLTATATSDDSDGNPVKLTYVWRVNGVVRRTQAATASLNDAFALTEARRADVVTVTATPNDGSSDGAAATASSTLANTLPVATVSISTVTVGAPTVAEAAATDADGDAVTFTYVWKINGITVSTQTTSSKTSSFSSPIVANNDTVLVSITPNDGAANGAAVEASGKAKKK